MTPSYPLIYAHRGARFDYPEMSRESYLGAVEQGADGFECDLRLTKDLVLICWHDATMERVAGRHLVIAESTYDEINSAYPVVTLPELLEIALEFGKGLALETKHPVPTHGAVEREVLRVLESYRSRIRKAGISVSIMSFSWFAIAKLRRAEWNTVYLIPYMWLSRLSPGRSIGPAIGAIEKLQQARRDQQKIFVWTVNTEEQLLLCREKGVDVIMTDRPGFARTILESK